MFPFIFAVAALAEEPPPPADRVDAVEAELQELRAHQESLEKLVADLQQEALIREAEALAAPAAEAAAPPPRGINAFNPAITFFGDGFVSVGVDNGAVAPGTGPWMRSLEIDARASVDPFANAVAVLAVEQEPPLETGGETVFSVSPEELYVDLVALPAGFSARLGAFRQMFGVTNRSHPHDLPWPDVPMPIAELLGEEGYSDTGAMLTWVAPLPVGLTLQAAVLDGSLFDPAKETAVPQWLGRLEVFHDAGTWDLGVGSSATGLGQEVVLGGDLMVRYKPNSWRSVMLLVEALSDLERTGVYAALQVEPTRGLYLGLRGDWLDGQTQLGGWLSYYTSEFLRVRVGARGSAEAVVADVQLTFVWGSHPVEPYWVNR